MRQIAGDHPEPATLAAFVEGNVSDEELTTVIAHLQACGECQTVVRVTAQFQRDVEKKTRPWPKGVLSWFIAAALILFAASPLLVHWHQSDPLRVLQGSHRAIAAQLTAFDYGIYEPANRSGRADPSREKALLKLKERLREWRTAENLHNLALGELALGRAAEARDLLAEAIALQGETAELLSDLAAAQIAMDENSEAAETSAKALEHEPDLPSARFNWALAVESLAIRPSAIAAWTAYLQSDSDPGWAGEARAHLKRLEQPPSPWSEEKARLVRGVDDATIRTIVGHHPQQVRAWVLGEVLPQWAGDRSAHSLAVARTIGEIRAASGDNYVRDVVEQAAGSNDPRLRDGILLYGRAAERLHARDMATARGRYAEAAELLQRAGSPLALSAQISAASMNFYDGRSDDALTLLADVASALANGGDRYPAVAAEAAWVRGLVWSRRDANASLEAYRAGLAAARRADDAELHAGLLSLAAEIMDRVGDPAEAARTRVNSLRQLDATAAVPDRMYVAYSSSAYTALRAGRPRLALAFIEAQRTFAGKDPQLLAESDGARALALRDLGRFAEAARLIHTARAEATAVPNQGLRDRTTSNLAFIAGTIDTATHPAAAIASLTEALDIWRTYEWHIHNATAYLLRGNAQLAMGQQGAAENDFLAGIAEMEKQRTDLAEPRLREAYFERADRLFDRLIELRIDQSRFDEALTIAERKRARELLTAIAAEPDDAAPADASALAAAVDPGTAIVEYAVLDRTLAIWVIRDGHIAFVRSDLSRSALQSMSREHLLAITQRNGATTNRLGRHLYDALVGPVSPYLAGAQSLVIVGDASLQTVPFAALLAPDRHYLIESFRLAYAPSASAFTRTSAPWARPTALLAVAQPGPSGMEFLTRAESEVEQVAELYPPDRVETGAAISPGEFLRRSGSVSMVHFAGHALLDDQQPAASALVFESASGQAPLFLRAADIAAARLPGHPLVVLAGCSTGRGPLRKNEGVDSLASAFLRAGARGVVATLWDLNDTSSSRLLAAFHRQLANGALPSDALRAAQLAMIQSPQDPDRRPEAWAGFVLVGTM